MSPPRCTRPAARAPLPIGHPKSVVTCPGCGATSEARTKVDNDETPLPAGLRERNAAILGASVYAEQASPMTTAVNATREQERRRFLRLIEETRAKWAGEKSAEVARAICDELSAEIDGQE